MALTSILKEECPKCGKIAVEKSRMKLGLSTLITLACGHLVSYQSLKSNEYEAIQSSDKRSLKQYQIDGVKFGEEADCNFILADEQGLGKTIQALALLRLHP